MLALFVHRGRIKKFFLGGNEMRTQSFPLSYSSRVVVTLKWPTKHLSPPPSLPPPFILIIRKNAATENGVNFVAYNAIKQLTEFFYPLLPRQLDVAKTLFPSAGYCSFLFFLLQRRLLPHLLLLGREGETPTGRRFSSLEFANVPSRHLLVCQSIFRQHSLTIDTYFELLGKKLPNPAPKKESRYLFFLLPLSSSTNVPSPIFLFFPLQCFYMFISLPFSSPFFSSSAHERTP